MAGWKRRLIIGVCIVAESYVETTAQFHMTPSFRRANNLTFDGEGNAVKGVTRFWRAEVNRGESAAGNRSGPAEGGLTCSHWWRWDVYGSLGSAGAGC